MRINRLRERAKTKSVLWWIFSYSNDHMVGPNGEQQKTLWTFFIRNESTYEHIIHIYEFMRNGYGVQHTFTTKERSLESLGVYVCLWGKNLTGYVNAHNCAKVIKSVQFWLPLSWVVVALVDQCQPKIAAKKYSWKALNFFFSCIVHLNMPTWEWKSYQPYNEESWKMTLFLCIIILDGILHHFFEVLFIIKFQLQLLIKHTIQHVSGSNSFHS